jgi:hypothetical protein
MIWLCRTPLCRASIRTYRQVDAYLVFLAGATWLAESPPNTLRRAVTRYGKLLISQISGHVCTGTQLTG